VLIELRYLRWAIVASQHRSLRQAAETLNVRQSTLSRNLRDMEHHIGAELFERSNGGTRPWNYAIPQLSLDGIKHDRFSLAKLGAGRGREGRLTAMVKHMFGALIRAAERGRPALHSVRCYGGDRDASFLWPPQCFASPHIGQQF
jgi:Bacterial regulatory helix-turn-helix protein, lysR family